MTMQLVAPMDGLQDSVGPADSRLFDRAALFVLTLAIFENFFLAAINNIYPITTSIVTITQLGITAAAVALLLIRPQRVNQETAATFLVIIVFFLLAAFLSGTIDPKALYDVMIIPIFMLLGLRVQKFPITYIYVLLGVILAVAILDAAFQDMYVALVNPQKYYLNTRVWIADTADSTTTDLGLYVGATRADNNVLDFLGADHRAGSIFLEPLSLGYFATIATIAILYAGKGLVRWGGLAVCLILTILADSRTGFAALLFLIAIFPFIRRIPASFVLMFPAIGLALLFLLYTFAGPAGDLGYRLGITFMPLGRASISDLIIGGIPAALIGDDIGDSGFLYLITNFGLIGATLVLILSCGIPVARFRDIRVPASAMIYIFFSVTFGSALFSIKTAAFLGFVLGTAASGALQPRTPFVEDDED